MTLNRRLASILTLGAAAALIVECSTAPKNRDEAAFLDRTESTTRWFKANIDGLAEQIDRSEAYVIFPDVAQWGVLIGGGAFGRGALYEADGKHIGWAAVNTGSIGLQAGVQGFRMLMVIEDAQTTGDVQVFDESFRVVGDTLIINKPGYLVNAKYTLSGGQLIVTADEFSAVLERL